MLRSRERRAEYLGLPIIVRWNELERGDGWGPGGHRFTCTYLIGSQGAGFGSWQQVPHVFPAYDAAAAYALAEAKRSIDAFWCS
jgi:hypothetical protein